MPIYTYRCRQCGHEFDRLQNISDAPVAKCEACGGPVKRVFHPVGIIFKGSGFYKTDYANKGKDSIGGKKDDTDKAGRDGELKKNDEKKVPLSP